MNKLPQQNKSKVFFIAFILGAFFTLGILYFTGVIQLDPQYHTDCSQACEDESCFNELRYNVPNPQDGVSETTIPQINSQVNDFYNRMYGVSLNYNEDNLIDLNQTANAGRNAGSSFISKKIFDNIFKRNQEANGVKVLYGWDGNNIILYLTPSRQDDIEVPDQPSTDYYIINSFCPPRCMPDAVILTNDPTPNNQ